MFKTRYHVFSDYSDDWFDDLDIAQNAYRKLGNANKRLYVEEYQTAEEYESGYATSENCVMSAGNYPL